MPLNDLNLVKTYTFTHQHSPPLSCRVPHAGMSATVLEMIPGVELPLNYYHELMRNRDRDRLGMRMNFCPECGRQRTTGTRYCGGCGCDFGMDGTGGRNGAPPEPKS